MQFNYQHTDFETDEVSFKCQVETESATLPDILEDFEQFLRGCGFGFKGRLDFVEEDK